LRDDDFIFEVSLLIKCVKFYRGKYSRIIR